EDAFRGDAQVQALLASAYEYFARPAEAERAYRASLDAEDDPELREALAISLTRQGRPDEAAPLLGHIFKDARQEDVGSLYLLAAGYQSQGRHEEALKLLDAVSTTFPAVKTDKEFRSLKKVSTKHAGTAKPVRSELLRLPRRGRKERSWSPRLWAIIGPTVGALVLAIYLYAAYAIGQGREVYVVNGLERPYTVVICGLKRRLGPMRHHAVEIPEGKVTVTVVDSDLEIPEQTCRIKTSFFARPFLHRVFVVNPDRVALLAWEQSIYSARPGSESPAPPKLHVGSLFYEFGGVDYKFSDFPREIRTESSRTTKERICQLGDLTAAQRVEAIRQGVGKAALVDYLKRNALYDPTEEFNLYALATFAGCDETLAFLKEGLPRRPLLVDWHRMYQTLTQKARPGYDIQAEYRALLEKRPEDPVLMYLAARVDTDRDEAERLYRRAAEHPERCPHALYALAMAALSRADFDEALGLSRKATEMLPGRMDFDLVLRRALLGLGRFDELIGMVRADRRRYPLDGEFAASEMLLLLRRGSDKEARGVIAAYHKDLVKQGDRATADHWRSYLEALRCYALGDVEGYLGKMGEVKEHALVFDLELTAGRLEKAATALSRMEARHKAEQHGLLYLAGRKAGREDLARKHFASLLEALREGTRDRRAAAAFLSADKPLDAKAVLGLVMAPDEKAILLAVFGVKFPEHRERFFELARKLNYARAFPHLFLKNLLGPGA
ncbi:MAG: tetratricopeptide repeat protein, partial [Planctomycetota bacterium]